MLFAIQEAKKLPENDNLRKIHNQFEQHNSGEQHTGRQRSDSAEPNADGFPKSISRCNCSTGTVTRYLFAVSVSQGGAVLFAPPRKAVAFLTTPSVCQKHGTGISLPAGSDQGYSP